MALRFVREATTTPFLDRLAVFLGASATIVTLSRVT